MAKKRRISNKAIVILKIISAMLMLFACCLYLFMNFGAFKRDLGLNTDAPLGSAQNPWYNLMFPVLFLLSISFVVYYVGNMIIRIETKQIWKADRLFFVYQIVFTGLLLITVWRWFLIDLTNALLPSIVMILAGVMNLFIPRIIDNDNADF
ncbi:MAG: hypothetical protein IKT33_01385 [Clostridia bacterium]|nr:hypothetical protein [Clostridia bacterium]